MHIKSVTISGFKTFRDKQVIDNLHQGHNVVVGINGSGKSTFFEALQFVLSDSHSNLKLAERRRLLHDGAGQSVMSAYVEILFDNRDRRLHVDSDEVSLRRTIGLKKDEYFVNRKRETRADVVSLLENAGFSRSNPYYIVRQNNAHRLFDMSDESRLQVLKEVAGTRVYDERRAESMKILRETDAKRNKIQEVIDHISERVRDLEGEKRELAECQRLDDQRRACEFLLAEGKLNHAQEQLEALHADQLEVSAMGDELRQKLTSFVDEESTARAELKAAREELTAAKADKEAYEREKAVLHRKNTRLELVVRRLEAAADADRDEAEQLREQLADKHEEVERVKRKLAEQAIPAFEAAQARCDAARQALEEAQQEQEHLVAKRARGQQYKTKKQRDAALDKEITSVRKSASKNQRAQDSTTRNIASLKKQISGARKTLTKCSKMLKEVQKKAAKSAKQMATCTADRQAAIAAMTEAQRAQDASAEKLAKETELHTDAVRRLDRTKTRAVMEGLRSVEEYVAERGLEGVHGPIIDLIRVKDSRFNIPVEVVANSQLFNVVVEDDRVAAELVAHLERTNGGRVTFMPLNRIPRMDITYPDDTSKVLPLITKLEFASVHAAAMKQVFGQTLLCRDRTVASEFSKKYRLDCVTLEGDQVNRRGALRGGFIDHTKSPLTAQDQVQRTLETMEQLQADHEKLKHAAMQAEQEVGRLSGMLQLAESTRSAARRSAATFTKQMAKSDETIRTKTAALEKQERRLTELNRTASQLEERVAALHEEKSTPFTTSLTPEDDARLAELEAAMADLQKRDLAMVQALETAKRERSRLESSLNEDLLKHIDEVKQRLEEIANGDAQQQGSRQEKLASKTQELALGKKDEEAAQAAQEKATERMRYLQETVDEMVEQVDSAAQVVEQYRTELETVSTRLHKLISKANLQTQAKEDSMRKIRELGTLPQAVTQLKEDGKSQRELHRLLRRANDSLKQYSHVNKKAMDQFLTFTEQRRGLLERKQELDDGHEAINELITTLDNKKNEAILRTFRQASMHFSQVFKELVPEGNAQLVMIRDLDAGAGSQRPAADDVSVFRGIALKVWFGGGGDKNSAFSGGQKTMVALSLIIAIQRCDPAPFCIFDEIDDNLDVVFAESLAKLLVKQARSGSQVFTITFNPSVVRAADKCYGVSLQHSVSSVHEQRKSEAVAFVDSILSGADVETATATARASAKRQRRARHGEGSFEDADEEGEEEDDDDDDDMMVMA